MYGLINKALRDMITEAHGECLWSQILDRSGVPSDSFLTMRSYDDAITFELAGATSEVLQAPLDACLEQFGEYWLLQAAPRHYAALLDASGATVEEFLRNLNALHDRITTTFLDYKPPTFHVSDTADGLLRVEYISQRQGLTPFVRGLIRGIAVRFHCDIEVVNEKPIPAEQGEHTLFDLRVGAA